MRSKKHFVWLLVGSILATGWFACKKWDNHIKPNEEVLDQDLMEQINSHANLSKFSEYLVKTGMDKVLAGSKTYTVWAPTNDALQELGTDVINDTAKLKAFLQNHISGQQFFTRMAADSVRVPMLNGKKVYCIGQKFDVANITQADVYVRNGVLNVVDKIVPPLQNIWQYINATTATYDQNAYIATLAYEYQDVTKAEIDSINPATGLPVYKPGTGVVKSNYFQEKCTTWIMKIACTHMLFSTILPLRVK
ncbi:MAG: fasciclin domain-containing protein [Chitinophagaceae bacterium]